MERAANAVPEISIGSAMIVRSHAYNLSNRHKPIHERAQDVIAMKEEKVQKMKYE
jgi:hypothetical protein